MTEEAQIEARSPKGGRPKKAGDEVRHRFTIRLTVAEKAAIEANAARAGLDVSEYLRRSGIRGSLPASPPANDHAVSPVPAALVSELNRIGVNVNQLARAVHRGSDFTAYWREVGAALERVLAKAARHIDGP